VADAEASRPNSPPKTATCEVADPAHAPPDHNLHLRLHLP
jgi:hypothetical protein